MSTKREVEQSIRELAKRLKQQATALIQKAEAIENSDMGTFAATMGNEWSGPAYYRQVLGEVLEQTALRETSYFERTLTEYFANQQRETAAAKEGQTA